MKFAAVEQDNATVPLDVLIAQQQKLAKEHGRELTEDEAFEEVIANALEGVMADGKVAQFLQQIEGRDKSLGARVRRFFNDIAQLIRDTLDAYAGVMPDSVEGIMISQLEDTYKQLQKALAEGIYQAGENFRQAEKNPTGEGAKVKYSLMAFAQDGKRFVDVQTDQQLFDGLSVSEMNALAKKIIKGKFVNKVIGIDNRTFVNGASAHEYVFPSKAITPDIREAKLRAAPELDNLIDAGTNFRNRPDGADGHYHPNAVGGFDYFDTIFKVGNEYFYGLVNIEVVKKGKLLKDITKIRNITKDIISSYGQNPKSDFLRDASIDSIRNPDGIVKKISATDSDGNQLSAGQQKYFAESEAVDENGNLLTLYHQTAEDITEFDPRHPGAGRSDDKTPFGIFLKRTNRDIGLQGKKQMPLYAKAENPLRAENREDLVRKLKEISPKYAAVSNEIAEMNRTFEKQVEEAGQKINDYMTEWRQNNPDASRRALYDDVTYTELSNAEDALVNEWVAKDEELSVKAKEIITSALIEAGYDSVFLAKDTGSFGRETDAIIVLNPNQVKSVDNKNPTDNPDIRFSVRQRQNPTVADMLKKENEKLKGDVEKLKELLKLQRSITGGTKFTASSVEAAARVLKKSTGATGDTAELAGLLNRFYEYIATERELTWESVKEQAAAAADWLQEHVKHRRSDYAQEILDQLHSSRIYLDESQKQEAAHRFGSFNAFRQAVMGSITVANEGNTSLDSFWQEMSALYPDVFDVEITAGDMPGALADVIDRLRNEDTSLLEYAYNRDMIRQDLVRQVYDTYWNVSTLRTFGDVKQAQINRLKNEHLQRMQQMKAENREKVEALKESHRAEVEMIRNAYRQRLDTQQKEISARYQESRAKAVEGRHKTESSKMCAFFVCCLCLISACLGHERNVS